MSFEGHVGKVEAVLLAIETLAPRNEDGELLVPFSGWVRRLRKDILKFRSWKKLTSVVLMDKGKEATDGSVVSDNQG